LKSLPSPPIGGYRLFSRVLASPFRVYVLFECPLNINMNFYALNKSFILTCNVVGIYYTKVPFTGCAQPYVILHYRIPYDHDFGGKI